LKLSFSYAFNTKRPNSRVNSYASFRGEGRFRTLSHLDISRAVNIESWNIGCCFPLLANRLLWTGSVIIKALVSLLLYLFTCWSTQNTQQTELHGKKMREQMVYRFSVRG